MEIIYFASVRETLGKESETLDIDESTVKTVADLIKHQRSRGDDYAVAFENTMMLRVAVNQVHALPNTAITNEDEVAFFPPITGG